MTKTIEPTLKNLIDFGRKDVDNTDKAVKSRAVFIDGLVAAGYTSANTATYKASDLKSGIVTNANVMHRANLLFIAAASIKIKGKRLSEADLAKFSNEAVSNKVMLAGTPKGNISKTVTWMGNATSWLSKVRKALETREMVGVAGTPRTTSTDTDIILGYLQKAYAKTFNDDVNLKCDLADLQKELRAIGKRLGAELKSPAKK